MTCRVLTLPSRESVINFSEMRGCGLLPPGVWRYINRAIAYEVRRRFAIPRIFGFPVMPRADISMLPKIERVA